MDRMPAQKQNAARAAALSCLLDEEKAAAALLEQLTQREHEPTGAADTTDFLTAFGVRVTVGACE